MTQVGYACSFLYCDELGKKLSLGWCWCLHGEWFWVVDLKHIFLHVWLRF